MSSKRPMPLIFGVIEQKTQRPDCWNDEVQGATAGRVYMLGPRNS